MTDKELETYVNAIKNYRLARLAILLLILATVIDVIFSFYGMTFPFSIVASRISILVGKVLKSFMINGGIINQTANIVLIFAYLIATLFALLYLLFFFQTKSSYKTYKVFFIFFCIDTALSFVFIFSSFLFLTNFLLHLLAVYYFYKAQIGAKALDCDFDDGVATKIDEVNQIYQFLKRNS